MESIVDSIFELLSTSDVPFRRLDRGVTEQELNLFELASNTGAETGTSTAKIMRYKIVNANWLGISFERDQTTSAVTPASISEPFLQTRLNTLSFGTRESETKYQSHPCTTPELERFAAVHLYRSNQR
jgi:hypothetical protein